MKEEELHGRSNSIATEKVILGTMMTFPDTVVDIVSKLSPDAFFDAKNRIIFEAICALHSENIPVDLISVGEKLKQTARIKEAGNYYYLSELTNQSALGMGRVEHYCRILLQLQVERSLLEMCQDIINMSDGTNDVADTLSYADRRLQRINEVLTFNNRMEHVSAAVEKAVDESIIRTENRKKGNMTGVTSGLKDLDQMTSGFKGGDLIILAARPAMGKTAMLLYFAKSAARQGVPVCVYSLEMDSVSLADRLILSETNISADKYRNGYISNSDFNEIAVAKKTLSELPIYVDDNPVVSMRYIQAHSKRMAKQGKCGLILVDYLQLADMREKGKNREQEVAQASRQAKIIAKELDVPFILLSQLNRACEERSDKKPQLSDLRESGAIEQDADKVIFVYRPEYYKLQNERGEYIVGEGALIMAKQRNGAVGEVKFRYNESLTQITDYNALSIDRKPF